ncbi:MAG: hypothetical protein KatS3mg081_2393 [Gemmatimonadales bacterium]|nr:MAG: hypothetical protein KatS3mg081_2393 [Gemmatimonadales bacterium]
MTRKEIGERIRRARARLKLTQAEVAARLGIPRSAVSLIESGKRDVTALELYRLSKLLGVSMEGLLGVEAREGEERFMLRAGELRAEEAAALREFEEWCRMYRRIEEWAGEVRDEIRPVDYPVTTQAQAAALAEEERKRLELGATPGRALLEVLEERLGVKVRLKVLPDSVSGASLRSAELGSAVLINSRHSAGRQVFTLAHEYFHLLAQGSMPGSEGWSGSICASPLVARPMRVERLADVFAGNLLLPKEQFIEQLQRLRRSDGSISKFDLVGVARHFGVSVQAVFVGLARLRLVSWELARRAYEDPELQDEILKVGGELVLQPRRLRRLGFKAYQAGRMTKARLAELLELGPGELEEYSRALGGRKSRGFKIGGLPG